MATVTIYTKDGETQVIKNVRPEDEAFYDDLPFNSENVTATRFQA